MTSDETFRYDPTPMNHAFPGQPDDCFDMVNQYGTYNIQKTADTDNAYPAIAQGMPKVGHFARRSKAMIDLLEFDPALLEPALGLFCVKAFFLSEDLDVHFIPPVTADNRRRLDRRLLKHGGSLRLGVGGKQKLARRGIDLYMTSDITHRNFHDAVPLSVDLRSV